jgi:hypothetical protein
MLDFGNLSGGSRQMPCWLPRLFRVVRVSAWSGPRTRILLIEELPEMGVDVLYLPGLA